MDEEPIINFKNNNESVYFESKNKINILMYQSYDQK